jgi:hypothetical protein
VCGRFWVARGGAAVGCGGGGAGRGVNGGGGSGGGLEGASPDERKGREASCSMLGMEDRREGRGYGRRTVHVNVFDAEGGGESSYDGGKLTLRGGGGTEGKHDAFTA